jgi:hypothetical protein
MPSNLPLTGHYVVIAPFGPILVRLLTVPRQHVHIQPVSHKGEERIAELLPEPSNLFPVQLEPFFQLWRKLWPRRWS